MEPLTSISPIDGRYREQVEGLSRYFSEFALMKRRLFVELFYLKELTGSDHLKLHDDFDLQQAQAMKDIEEKTKHDVKACEYYIKGHVPLDIQEKVHMNSHTIQNIFLTL